ncbi:tetratricopeptide repeat protein [Blastopirellula sp. JC732]|uniref:Tetratricopeptide repeat protein n=1 Tax=Blastopirellula sediminis TaxID=2894196 RepID=A0A9X1SEB8_9BACT|nr:tetratricopeptide repeat protein [Blastopirellula sediminis]MCC9609569.1 tetratricopeptide repeat protein [Blastopirellula sediminis]MCC9627655.1 tetratricopeptide repeat protein [Blastopirellula sediminis]
MALNKIIFQSYPLRAGVASLALAGAMWTAPLRAEEASGGLLDKLPSFNVRQVQFTGDSDENQTLDEYIRESEERSKKKSGNGFTATLKSAGKSIQDAFTIKSSNVPADDPLSLSNTPDHLDVNIYLSTGRILEQQGKFEEAGKQYMTALDQYPDNLFALLSYARLMDRQGKSTAALEFYQKAATAHPESAIAMNDLGLCYLKLKRFDDAMASIFKATTIEPENKRYRNNMASALVDANRLEEAFSQLEYAHGAATAHYNLGYLLYKKGDANLARLHLNLALEKDPELHAARQLLMIVDRSQPEVAYRPGYGQQPNLRRLPAAPNPPQLNFNQGAVGNMQMQPPIRR